MCDACPYTQGPLTTRGLTLWWSPPQPEAPGHPPCWPSGTSIFHPCLSIPQISEQWHTRCWLVPLMWSSFPGSVKPFVQRARGRESDGKTERERKKLLRLLAAGPLSSLLTLLLTCVDFPLCFSVFAVYSTSWTSQKWDSSIPAGEQIPHTTPKNMHGLFHVLLNFD